MSKRDRFQVYLRCKLNAIMIYEVSHVYSVAKLNQPFILINKITKNQSSNEYIMYIKSLHHLFYFMWTWEIEEWAVWDCAPKVAFPC